MKRIDKLTAEQESRLGEWRDKWIAIGLKTGDLAEDDLMRGISECYQCAGLKSPQKYIRCESPLVLALAAPIAAYMLKQDDTVRGAVDGAVSIAVDDAVDGAVSVAVRGAVRDAVDGAVSDAVGGAVGGVVRGAVSDAVSDAVGGAVRDHIKNNWHKRFGGQFWVGGWWWGSPSFVSFFTDVCDLELDPKIKRAANAYRLTCESGCWWWPHTNFVMYCDRPKWIDRDDRGRLHSTTRSAIAWNGFEIYALWGVRFLKPEEVDLWHQITQSKISAKDILKIENMEHRMCALKFMGAEKILQELDSELLQKSNRGNELHKIVGVFDVDAYYLKYSCPSTGRVYVSGVDPKVGARGSADECMAWKFGIKPEQYGALVNES